MENLRHKKNIFLLIGAKGSGKSFIGELFDRHFGITFIRVEDLAKQIKSDNEDDNERFIEKFFLDVEKLILALLEKLDSLVFESTGLTDDFDKMIVNLQSLHNVVVIGVKADADTCLSRIRTRDQSIHIKISEDQVIKINAQVLKKNHNCDMIIDNNNKTEEELVDEIKTIVDKVKLLTI